MRVPASGPSWRVYPGMNTEIRSKVKVTRVGRRNEEEAFYYLHKQRVPGHLIPVVLIPFISPLALVLFRSGVGRFALVYLLVVLVQAAVRLVRADAPSVRIGQTGSVSLRERRIGRNDCTARETYRASRYGQLVSEIARTGDSNERKQTARRRCSLRTACLLLRAPITLSPFLTWFEDLIAGRPPAAATFSF